MCLQQSSYCRSLEKLMGKAERIIGFYGELVEPVMGYPRYRELIASLRGPSVCYHECLLVEELESRVANSVTCVIGPAGYNGDLDCDVVGAPEGGILPVIERGLKPLYVTGDLDIDLKLLDLVVEVSGILLVHIHGDNIERFSSYERRLSSKRVIYTSQVLTHNCVLPLGGFTDGDRALIVAMLAGAREVRALGYNFVDPIQTHKSIPVDPSVKRVKLMLAWGIVEKTAKTLGYDIVKRGGSLTLLRLH